MVFNHQSKELLDPELHGMIPFDAIGLLPHEAGGYPGEPDKTGTSKESCDGDVVTGAGWVIFWALNRGAGELAVVAERTDVAFQSG